MSLTSGALAMESIPLIDLGRQSPAVRAGFDGAIARVMGSQQFIMGPEVTAFEEEVARYLNVPHAVSVASGTDALLLALRALDLPAGQHVIVPAFTFFATAGAVWNAGLVPVFCDVDTDTFCVTAETVEAAWTRETVAVIPVHMFGLMAPMNDLEDLAVDRRVLLLEDAAQAFGAHGPSGWAGGCGDACAHSFFPTKNLGAFGDGGMVTTSRPDVADRVAKLRVHGGRKMYHHEMVGTNSRLDTLQAAVLREKLPHVDDWTRERQAIAVRYAERLYGLDELTLPHIPDQHRHVFNQFTVRTAQRDGLRSALREHGIGSGVYYPVPLHLQDCFAELGGSAGDLPGAESLCERVLSLPMFPGLRDSEVDRVTDVIRKFFKR